MNHILSMYDVSTSLTILTNKVPISVAIMLFHGVFIAGYRVELLAILAAHITPLESRTFEPRLFVVQIIVLVLYTQNLFVGVICQCIFDRFAFTLDQAKTRAALRFFMLIFMSLAQTAAGGMFGCYFVVLIHVIFLRLIGGDIDEEE